MDTRANTVNQVNMNGVPEDLVFGLDIGTRSIVGTVGYKNREGRFIVVAQTAIPHETRAMLDGQIHDIGRVAGTIEKVKERLEEVTGRTYQDVCIAAAGRVLKTVEEEAEVVFGTETVVTEEHIYSLDMLAVEKAHSRLREQEGDEVRFYCVGYSVKQYYQNDYPISNLEGHKCNKVRTELIATFLPDEVVDGLYAAVERAGLYVANLTLEPIAAINVAIPERFRLLNIALVDVGAGTSDISITRDGSIIAYGMIPSAGDEITECLAKQYLADFQEADRLKCASTLQDEVEFHDIMGLPMTVSSAEIAETVRETVHSITQSIADKIIELNGDRTVSAVFIVGGGGKVRGFAESLAECLGLAKERVALRGTEVLGGVTFLQEDVQIDSLLVTPIGICLNYYEQRNNFIFVYLNGERLRLYDNNRLTVLDAALQVGFPNESLFPQRGGAVNYTVNGERRMLRGEPGEAAVIRVNGEETGISTPIVQNDTIEITASTKGTEAAPEISGLTEYQSTLEYYVNGKKISCPRLAAANGTLVSEYYQIQDGDEIEILDYYTVEQVLEYMDVTTQGEVLVNHLPADIDTKVYENFSVDFTLGDPRLRREAPVVEEITESAENLVSEPEQGKPAIEETLPTEEPVSGEPIDLLISQAPAPEESVPASVSAESADEDLITAGGESAAEDLITAGGKSAAEVSITVNGEPVVLRGKTSYIMVDVLDFYPIDTSVAHGERLEIKKNGMESNFTEPVFAGDAVVLRWIG